MAMAMAIPFRGNNIRVVHGFSDKHTRAEPLYPLRWQRPELWSNLKLVHSLLIERRSRVPKTPEWAVELHNNLKAHERFGPQSSPKTKTRTERPFMHRCARKTRNRKGQHKRSKGCLSQESPMAAGPCTLPQASACKGRASSVDAETQSKSRLDRRRELWGDCRAKGAETSETAQPEGRAKVHQSVVSVDVGRHGLQGRVALNTSCLSVFKQGDFYMKEQDYVQSTIDGADVIMHHGVREQGNTLIDILANSGLQEERRDPDVLDYLWHQHGNCILETCRHAFGATADMKQAIIHPPKSGTRSYLSVGARFGVKMKVVPVPDDSGHHDVHCLLDGEPHAFHLATTAGCGSITYSDRNRYGMLGLRHFGEALKVFSDRASIRIIKMEEGVQDERDVRDRRRRDGRGHGRLGRLHPVLFHLPFSFQ